MIGLGWRADSCRYHCLEADLNLKADHLALVNCRRETFKYLQLPRFRSMQHFGIECAGVRTLLASRPGRACVECDLRHQCPCRALEAHSRASRMSYAVLMVPSEPRRCLRNEKAQTCSRTSRLQRFGRDYSGCCFYRREGASVWPTFSTRDCRNKTMQAKKNWNVISFVPWKERKFEPQIRQWPNSVIRTVFGIKRSSE